MPCKDTKKYQTMDQDRISMDVIHEIFSVIPSIDIEDDVEESVNCNNDFYKELNSNIYNKFWYPKNLTYFQVSMHLDKAITTNV